MLANECVKCTKAQQKKCAMQFQNARKRDKIFCPLDGSVFVISLEY